ncbi:MAG: hypothetical protein RLZZ399_922 [Verrucomicrobiota bacterium]
MKTAARRLWALCRGETATLAPLLEARSLAWPLTCAIVIILGCGTYGAAIGVWRAPLQAVFTGIKMPLLIFLTWGGNALLNGLLAQILGAELSFRQTALTILMSFTIAALLLGALSPVALFILANTPSLASTARGTGHSVTLLADVGMIAYAGIIANRRLISLLRHLCPTPAIAQRVFWAWLAGNLFFGAQVSWILRPFVGSPALAVEFLRSDPLRGNFYEAVYKAARHLLF